MVDIVAYGVNNFDDYFNADRLREQLVQGDELMPDLSLVDPGRRFIFGGNMHYLNGVVREFNNCSHDVIR